MIRALFILGVLLLLPKVILAQWTSQSTGDYTTVGNWVSNDAPPANGILYELLTIDQNDSIYRAGDITIDKNGGNTGSIDIENGGDFVVSTNLSIEEGVLTIKNGGVVEVFGNLTDGGKLDVQTGGTLIIHGNMDLDNTQTTLSGNVIVFGDVTLKNTDMLGSSNLVVGGVFASGGGNLNAVTGDVYLLDPTVNPNPPDVGNPAAPPQDLDDLISDSEDFDLIEEIVEVGGSTNYVWDGSVSSAWGTSGNWSDDKVPGVLDVVVIDDVTVMPVCPSVLTVQDLTINAGATWTIPIGSEVTVFGDITIGAGAQLIVENSNGSPTSFINYGSVTGNITFKWTYSWTGDAPWWLIGHPIPNALMSSYDALVSGGNDYAMYDYQDPANMARISKTAFDFSAQDEIRGYIFKAKNTDAVIEHSGIPNSNADYSKALQSEWQVIANPYPSYYQFPTEPDATGLENTEGTVYVTVSTSNSDKSYETYNTVSGFSSPGSFTGLIAPGQGFYIETTSGNTGMSVTMSAANRVHDPAVAKTQLKSVKQSSDDILRLKLTNSTGTDEAVIAFKNIGSESFTRYDSEQKIVSGSGLSFIYSLKEDVKTVINVLPENSELSIPIGIKAKEGNHVLSFSGISSMVTGSELVLEDKLLNKSIALTVNTEYNFDVEEGIIEDRFVLHLKKAQVATDIESETKVGNDVLIFLQGEDLLKVTCNWNYTNKSVEVYSITGEIVAGDTFAGNNYSKQLNLRKGLYVVKVYAGSDVFVKKIIIK